MTIVVVCGTANHYTADAWGGILALCAAYGIERARVAIQFSLRRQQRLKWGS
jgi:hypothetical protein